MPSTEFHINPSSRNRTADGRMEVRNKRQMQFLSRTALLLLVHVTCNNKTGRNGSVVIATRYGSGRSGDRVPLGARFSAPVQKGTGVYPASYTMCTGSFRGAKQPGHGVDPPPRLAPKLNKK